MDLTKYIKCMKALQPFTVIDERMLCKFQQSIVLGTMKPFGLAGAKALLHFSQEHGLSFRKLRNCCLVKLNLYAFNVFLKNLQVLNQKNLEL